MKRVAAGLCVGLLTTSLVLAGNPHSQFRGQGLGNWMKLYWTWFLGGDQAGHVKNTVFLPLPAGEPSEEDPTVFVGKTDFTLRPGEAFVLPMFVWIGETYLEENVPDDNPNDILDEWFTDPDNVTVMIRLDGKLIIDSAEDDLNDFFFDAQFFDETIFYDEPIEYAPDVHAIGAKWVKGIGFVHHPLSKGKHTLELFVYSHVFGFGFDNTWHITVRK